MREPTALILSCVVLLATVACGGSNVGALFGPRGGGGSNSKVQPMVTGGTALDRRPRTEAVFPDGPGWPGTVPVVVQFDQSVNRDSVAPKQAEDPPGLFVRDVETQQAVPVTYDFLLGDRVVLIRPLAEWPKTPTASSQVPQTGVIVKLEIVIDPGLRNVDGLSYGGAKEVVLGQFQADQDVAFVDGVVVTTLPRNKTEDNQRETPIYVIFDKPADISSVNSANFEVQQDPGVPVSGRVSFPLTTLTERDGRVLRFDPDALLDGDQIYSVLARSTIAFGTAGHLNNGNTVVVGQFRTLAFTAPLSLSVGNATPGFPDKVNRNNIESLVIDVALGDSARAGDEVIARIYGLDVAGNGTDEYLYVESKAGVVANGAQTVSVPFDGRLGTVDKPIFVEGPLELAAQSRRGGSRSGYFVSAAGGQPAIDVTVPTLNQVGPPNGGSTVDLLTDQEWLSFYGEPSEQLGAATLTAGGNNATMYASNDSLFVETPIDLQLRTEPFNYQLAIIDAAGNMAPMALSGRIVPRGVVNGSVDAGMLLVEAYDEATLAAIPNATVVIEPGMPTTPPTNQQMALTGSNGRVMFGGLSASNYTITVVRAGYDLTTVLDTGAGFASIPLRPLAGETGTLSGTAAFLPSPNVTALVGSNLLDDFTVEAIETDSSAPNDIPATAIRPNRLHALTAYAGSFEPLSVPTFSNSACQLCGTTGSQPTAPEGPTPPDGTASPTLTLAPVTITALPLAMPYNLDFNNATGLDVTDLVEPPRVRIRGSLRGFPGMTLFGVGLTTPVTSGVYAVNGTYSYSTALSLTPFAPLLFISTQARDNSGNLARHRHLLDASTGLPFQAVGPPGIPEITSTAGGSSTAPRITIADRLDSTALAGLLGYFQITATDAAQRGWRLLYQDEDGAGGDLVVQFPDLRSVTGLAPGTWSVRSETQLVVSFTLGVDRFVFEVLHRDGLTYARAASANVSVK